MQQRLTSFVFRNEKIFPFLIFLLFLAVSLPGVSWGVPALWHPDEVVWRVDKALAGELIFDETEPDFNYPSLPKYVMFVIGKIVYGMGYSRSIFIISARIFSALLGGLSVVLVYHMARLAGAKPGISALASLLCIVSGVVPANSRLAHNDIYLLFFSILCVFFAIKYQLTKSRLWIYASFLSVGLAASSKYTGGSLVLIPIFVMFILNWMEIRKDWIKSFEIIFIGLVLSFLGFAMGTPKAILWMAYYFKRVIPALEKLSLYSFNSGSPIGLYGQWGAFYETVGGFVYLIFGLALVWFIAKLVSNLLNKDKDNLASEQTQVVVILLVSLLFFDMPFLFAVHYLPRHFIPFIPFLSVLGALFIAEMMSFSAQKKWKSVIPIFLFLGISYSLLRLASIALLYMNDARMPASDYIAQLPGEGKTIEYTLYPPIVNKRQFANAYNYPIYFVKYPDEVVPTGGRLEFNQGEAGLIDRDVDYLVIDTFTYARFYTDSVCVTNPIECDFFKRLVENEIPSFHLVKEFTYQLPPYLPSLSVNSVNPEIRIYERVR